MKGKIEIVQLLRGLAALMVCFFHMKGILNYDENRIGSLLFGNGSIGVPLFFMISGFIMVVTTHKSEATLSSVKTFFLKRAIRILPLYYLLTLVLIVGIGGVHYYFVENPRLLLSGVFFFPTFENTVGPSYGMPPLEVGWSLNYEVFFYIILGFSIFFGKFRWRVLLVVMSILVYAVPLFLGGSVMPRLADFYGYTWSYLNLMTNPVILFFIVGILLGLFYRSNYLLGSLTFARVFVAFASLIFVLSYFGLLNVGEGYYSNIAICGLLLFALLLRSKFKPYNLSRAFVLIGDMSYSIYLVHPIVIVFLPKILRACNVGAMTTTPFYFVLVLVLIVGLSYSTYVLVEKKLSDKLAILLLRK